MSSEGDMEISLDKLPIKRLDFIEESGLERFPPEIGYEEKTLNLVRRIDFAWAVERDLKKQKKAKESSASSAWQGLVENLQLAHQELSVIIDLINTVEANDAVAVAGMNRPKLLPNEVLSDLSVSAATKLQCYRHLSKYFKQSANSLEQQIAKEARFYGALIRLQQNWKVKRHRLAANAPGSEGFLIDLSDNSMSEQSGISRIQAFSMVRVDHDASGMLALNIPKNSCRTIQFGFLGVNVDNSLEERAKLCTNQSEEASKETKMDTLSDEDYIRETHMVLRDAHRATFHEQIFQLVSRESFDPSLGVNVTGIRENYLELSLKPGVSVFISLEPPKQKDQIADAKKTENIDDISNGASFMESKKDANINYGHPDRTTYEIYLQQLFHDEIFGKVKDNPSLSGGTLPGQRTKDSEGLVSHLCLSLSHRIFSSKVLKELENLAIKIPYLQLITQPTWHSRSSSWTLSVKAPEAMLNGQSESDIQMNNPTSLFQTRVLVKDDCISVEGGGSPTAVGLFKSTARATGSKNKFNCDLVDLPVVLLLQVASKIVDWLHEEALKVGIKTKKDFLSLTLEIDHGEKLSLVGHVDPEDAGCISWSLTLEDRFTKEPNVQTELADGESGRRFLGYLSLDELYFTLMDLVSLCTGIINH